MTQDVHERPARSATGSTRLAAVGVIWVASAVVAIGTPDLVSGSEQEHIPIAALTVWLWATVASGYAAMTPVSDRRDWLLTVLLVWAATAAVAVAAPEMVTGSDPTRIPLAALVTPPVAAVVTGFLALNQAAARRP